MKILLRRKNVARQHEVKGLTILLTVTVGDVLRTWPLVHGDRKQEIAYALKARKTKRKELYPLTEGGPPRIQQLRNLRMKRNLAFLFCTQSRTLELTTPAS